MTYANEINQLAKRGVNVDEVRTYAEMRRVAGQFLVGRDGYKLRFLILVGPPGSSKSWMFQSAQDAAYVTGRLSTVGMYVAAFRGKDKPLIIDDVDGLLEQSQSVGLLKALTDSRRPNVVSWHTQNRWLENEGIPQSFETSSQVCVIANDLAKIGKNYRALLDRATIVFFTPPPREVHEYVGTWFDREFPDAQDVYGFIGEYLHLVVEPSCRLYTNAVQSKRLGDDWKSKLLQRWHGKGRLLSIVAQLVNDGIPRGDAMEQEWVKRTLTFVGKAMSRSYFYRMLAEYEAVQNVNTRGMVKVQSTSPQGSAARILSEENMQTLS